MRTPQENLLAKLLLMDVGFAFEYIDHIREDWFTIQWQKNVFVSIRELLEEQKKPDLLQVIEKMKSKKQIQKGLIPKIAGITTTRDDFHSLQMSSLINEVTTEYEQRQTLITLNQIQNSITDGTATREQTLDRLTSLLDSLKEDDVKINETTAYYIGEVIAAHDKAKSGVLEGLEMPYSNLKNKVLLENVDLLVVGARPAMGKTAFAVSTAVKLAFEHKKKIDFFSLEMSKAQIVRRIIGCLTRIDTRRIRFGKCDEKELQIIRSLQERMEMDHIRIYEGSHTIGDMSRIVTKNKYTVGTDLIIVDYLQKITASRGHTEFEKATANSNDLKKLVQDIKIPCLALAQLKRSDKNDRPKLSSLRGTGDIEQDASIVAFLHRPEYYGESEMEDGSSAEGIGEFIIAKNREGSIDIVRFNVELKTSRWESDAIETDEGPF